MAETCACNEGLKNTGTPGCPTIMNYAEMLIAVPKYGSDGTLNYIDLTATLDAAYFTGKINEADVEDRWFPIPRFKNAASERAESVSEGYDDGTSSYIHQGVRPFSFLIPKQSAELLGQLEAFRCVEFGVYIVDRSGNLRGSLKEAGKLYPIGVDNQSWIPQLTFGTASTIEKINLSFNFDLVEQDSDLRIILASELTGTNLLSLKGLLDVYVEYSSISTTGFKAKLFLKYGSALTKVPVKGLTITDFVDEALATSKLYNVTDSASLAITSVTESPDGTYTFVFVAQTVADKIKVHPVKAGFDFTSVKASLVTIA